MESTAAELPRLIVAESCQRLDQWIQGRQAEIDATLDECGAVLFRGFDVTTAEAFRRFALALSANTPIKYSERSSPRSEVADRIYTSTDHPADQPIALHSEQSYNNEYPLRICFFCLTPATRGGNTPIASNRAIKSRLSAPTCAAFRERKILYQRNFNHGLGLRWQEAFGTTDRAEVAAYCEAHGIEIEWIGAERLRTRQVRPAFRTHPRTGEQVWFNHGLFFNVASLPEDVALLMADLFQPEDYPTQTFWGDGEPISAAVMQELVAAYRDCTVTFQWQAGDVLLLDNMLASHGREPYSGERKVLTFMQDLVSEPAAHAS